jgi:hypothetical protein
MALFGGIIETMSQDYIFWPLVGVAVLLIVVFVVMRMMKKPEDD